MVVLYNPSPRSRTFYIRYTMLTPLVFFSQLLNELFFVKLVNEAFLRPAYQTEARSVKK